MLAIERLDAVVFLLGRRDRRSAMVTTPSGSSTSRPGSRWSNQVTETAQDMLKYMYMSGDNPFVSNQEMVFDLRLDKVWLVVIEASGSPNIASDWATISWALTKGLSSDMYLCLNISREVSATRLKINVIRARSSR